MVRLRRVWLAPQHRELLCINVRREGPSPDSAETAIRLVPSQGAKRPEIGPDPRIFAGGTLPAFGQGELQRAARNCTPLGSGTSGYTRNIDDGDLGLGCKGCFTSNLDGE